jgi:hypothetical protein
MSYPSGLMLDEPAAVPESAEQVIEDLKRKHAARELLLSKKVDVQFVYGVWDPWESDRVLRVDKTDHAASVVIYIDNAGEPKTCLMVDDHVVVRDGWE